MLLPIAAEFSYQIPQPPFSKAVRDYAGLALVDILQRVVELSDVIGITDTLICYRSLVRAETNTFLGYNTISDKKAPKFIEKTLKSSA